MTTNYLVIKNPNTNYQIIEASFSTKESAEQYVSFEPNSYIILNIEVDKKENLELVPYWEISKNCNTKEFYTQPGLIPQKLFITKAQLREYTNCIGAFVRRKEYPYFTIRSLESAEDCLRQTNKYYDSWKQGVDYWKLSEIGW